MSICSMASAMVTPAREMVASKGYRFTTINSKGRIPCCGERLHVLLMVPAAEDAAEHLGVQRLQPAVHHFGKPGVGGDVHDLHPGALQMPPRAAGAVDLHSAVRQPACKVGQTEFVADADDGTFHRNGVHRSGPSSYKGSRRQPEGKVQAQCSVKVCRSSRFTRRRVRGQAVARRREGRRAGTKEKRRPGMGRWDRDLSLGLRPRRTQAAALGRKKSPAFPKKPGSWVPVPLEDGDRVLI